MSALGVLGEGLTSATNPTPPGAGTWYSFTLGTAGTLTADTLGSLNDDTEIALFDAAGNTLIANDDGFDDGYLSQFSIALGAGDYYLAVGPYNSRYNWDPTTDSQIGWERNGFSGGGDAFVFNNQQPHTLNQTFNATATVPEPSTFALMGLGLLGGTVVTRRRRNLRSCPILSAHYFPPSAARCGDCRLTAPAPGRTILRLSPTHRQGVSRHVRPQQMA